MKRIELYINEKLIINKDTKVEDLRKYMVTFGVSKGNGVLFRVDNSLEDIKAYIKRNNISKKDVYVFRFPLEVRNELLLQNELLDKCEDNYNDNISWAELIIWCEKNNIDYIGRDYVFNESLIDEKLILNKDINSDEESAYILFYRKNGKPTHYCGSIEDIAYFIFNHKNIKNIYAFKCPESLLKELIDRWENFDPLEGEDIWEWMKKNKITTVNKDALHKALFN